MCEGGKIAQMEYIEEYFQDGKEQSRPLSVDKFPEFCPVCMKLCNPILLGAYISGRPSYLQVLFQCPGKGCGRLFVGIYEPEEAVDLENRVQKTLPSFGTNSVTFSCQYYLSEVNKISYGKRRQFSSYIMKLSLDFCDIYNESCIAEQNGLSHICGVGYRKALEHLVKDFVLSGIDKSDEETQKRIQKEHRLQRLIEEYIEDEKVKRIARHAWWLGNDETHYARRWPDKGLPELKKLIDMVVNWVEIVFMDQELCVDENGSNPC